MKKHKLFQNVLTYSLLLCTMTSPLKLFSAELDSTNFKIVGATTNGGGGTTLTSDGDYSALFNIGTISNDPRTYSSSYMMYNDPQHAFTAAVPQVGCFETTTDGYSNCTTGPAELTTGGMVAICGEGGCYNRGRFEIVTNNNPTDTLYSIEVSIDNFVSDLQYVDGLTYRLESNSTHNIDDFKTKSDWETETFNIQGLDASTTYYIRIAALHGTFTQSDTSPVSNATTSAGVLFFDIDIAIESGVSTESLHPYTVSFTGSSELVGGTAAVTATQRIWLDASCNSEGGFAIVIQGKNGGLYSPTTSQTIESHNMDLDLASSGFGLQSGYIDYDDNPSLGTIVATTSYAGSINNVGEVSTTPTKVYEADGPIVNGRMALKLIAKPGTDKTPANDYEEEIFILFIPRY